MTDDRIAQTEGTPAKDRFRTSRPVEARLAMIRRKWDKENRTALEGSIAGRNLARICRSELSPSSFPLNLSYRKDRSLCLWLPRIGRLNAHPPAGVNERSRDLSTVTHGSRLFDCPNRLALPHHRRSGMPRGSLRIASMGELERLKLERENPRAALLSGAEISSLPR
jgi:hypothetical protein